MARPRSLNKLALNPAQTIARRALDQKIWECIQQGKAVPCLANPEPYDGEGPMRERIEAAQRCGDCPAFAECDDWRLSADLKGGVIAAGHLV
jgi:hypothetical protein